MDIDLKPCPFCGGEAHLSRWRERGNRDGYYSPKTYIVARCTQCEARTRGIVEPYMIDITQCSVEDFRYNPALRAAEEERLAAIIKEREQECVGLWNKRMRSLEELPATERERSIITKMGR